MAVIALTLAGAALGSAWLPAGISLLGATITGGGLGAAIGSVAGGIIDQYLFASHTSYTGPRLTDTQVTASTEGATLYRVFGRLRIGGQIIWSTDFEEQKNTTTQSSGGKGLGGGSTTTTSYTYFGNFAIGLCEGEIKQISRVWINGTETDISKFTYRLYTGTETQGPDPKIEAVEGSGAAPSYRGVAYLVFEHFPLEDYGNSIPQITVEVIRIPPSADVRLEDLVRSVTMIPAMGEFVYSTDRVKTNSYSTSSYVDAGGTVHNFTVSNGDEVYQNVNTTADKADVLVALDNLAADLPACDHVSLVVSWMGTDLRCGSCLIRPEVEVQARTDGAVWQVSGVSRSAAHVVSADATGPLIGGTPSDLSVFQLITELKARGYAVTLYPFVMMDIASGNGLPDPWGGSEQAAFPWRGRITCHPAPGRSGTPDKTSATTSQVAAFFGTAAPGHFGSWDGSTVPYGGPAEWSFRRLVLHYAKLAAAAGGVESIVIGSELVGLNQVRDSATNFPSVAKLKALAADVKAIVGSGCKVGYGADWTELTNYRPSDGTNDLFFHLDPLWSDTNVDFIGVDNYMPLADWRDGFAHLDALAGYRSQYDTSYLQSNIEGGELFSWYYASYANRLAQVRSTITDGYGEPWVFRYKDLRSWWTNQHYNRPAGVRSASPTAWVPQSKPIRFTEIGAPSIDKAANQPNVFYDPKSAESAIPYFSTGRRDDMAQRTFLEAVLTYWATGAGHNPTSSVYGGPMIDTTKISIWTWDARPYPAFPALSGVWRDGDNWRLGHWINGKVGLVLLRDVVNELCEGLGVPFDTSKIYGLVRGYLIDQIMSARDAITPLQTAYFFDGYESDGKVRFIHRGGPVVSTFDADHIVESGKADSSDYSLVRAQETELPGTAKLRYYDVNNAYHQGVAEARRLKGQSLRTNETTVAVVFDQGEAQSIVDVMLIEQHVQRETASFTLPPSALALDPADIIVFQAGGRQVELRVDSIGFEYSRPTKATRTDSSVYELGPGSSTTSGSAPADVFAPNFQFLDLPLLKSEWASTAHAPYVAAYSSPWASVALFRSPSTTGYQLDTTISQPATIGALAVDLAAGVTGRWDRANTVVVVLPATEALSSVDELFVLNGSNVGAILGPTGEWEVIQWVNADLIGPNTYALTKLLRGQLGTNGAMGSPTPAGSAFVLLDLNVQQTGMALSQRGLSLHWKYGPAAKPISDSRYVEVVRSFSGIGLRPYSPCQLKAAWQSSGDVVLSWKRRTRMGGDDWQQIEVPLSEEVEAYEVDILSGTTVKRTLSVSSPTATYTQAMQVADFGAAQSSLTWAAYQRSNTFGRGAQAKVTSNG